MEYNTLVQSHIQGTNIFKLSKAKNVFMTMITISHIKL